MNFVVYLDPKGLDMKEEYKWYAVVYRTQTGDKLVVISGAQWHPGRGAVYISISSCTSRKTVRAKFNWNLQEELGGPKHYTEPKKTTCASVIKGFKKNAAANNY